MDYKKALTTFATTLLLTACGGGSNSPAPELQQRLATASDTGHVWVCVATWSDVEFAFSIDEAAGQMSVWSVENVPFTLSSRILSIDSVNDSGHSSTSTSYVATKTFQTDEINENGFITNAGILSRMSALFLTTADSLRVLAPRSSDAPGFRYHYCESTEYSTAIVNDRLVSESVAY